MFVCALLRLGLHLHVHAYVHVRVRAFIFGGACGGRAVGWRGGGEKRGSSEGECLLLGLL